MKKPSSIVKVLFVSLSLLLSVLVSSQTYEQDTELASTYYAKGVESKNKFNLDSADFYLKKASDLFKKHEVWENYLIVNNELGAILLQRGQTGNAVTFFNEQINIAVEKFGESNEYLASSYNNLGLAFFFNGDIDGALGLYDKSLAIRIKLGDKESIFASNLFNDMGNAYTEKGEFDLALDYYKKALEIRKKLLGDKHPETAVSYNNLGIIYREQAQYNKAIEYHKKAIEIQIGIFGEDFPDLANYYQGIGNAYKDKLEMDQAMAYYQKAYSIRKKAYSEDHPLVAKDILNIAVIYTEKGDFDNAIGYFQQALSIQKKTLPKNHPDMAMTYNNLGNIYDKDGQFELALTFYLSALDIKRTAVGDEHPEIADYYNNIGNIYMLKQQYEEALEYQQKALDIKMQFYGTEHPGVVLPYLNIGNIYYQQEDYATALEYFQRSLTSNVKNFNSEPSNTYANPIISNYYNAQHLLSSLKRKAEALVGKYKAELKENDLLTAFTTYQKCDSTIEVIRKKTVSKSDKLELGKIAAVIYDAAIDVCFKLNQLEKDKVGNLYLKEGFYFSEKNKAGALLQALAGAEARKFAGIPDNLLDLEKELKNQISFYEKKLAEAYDEDTERAVRDGLFKVNTKYNKLIKDFEKRFPKYHEMKYSKEKLTVGQIQAVLDEKTAVRSYFMGDSLISIFTITKDEITMDKSVKEEGFDYQVFNFRRLITSGRKSEAKEYAEEAYKYHEILFPSALPEGISRMVIIPDGNLGLIPFDILLTEEYTGNLEDFNKYPYLIKKCEISYNYSVSLFYKQLKRKAEAKWENESWLGIAPVFTDTKDFVVNENYITALPGTESEINTIKQNFEKEKLSAKAILFDEASEKFMKSSEVSNYKYLHIATHGFVNSEKPELSGIVLSENKEGNNDGVLYTGEIYNLEINSDLVVLSACETGLGKVSKGEGIIGLSRALLYAGTNNIVVSLWKVADISTSELMIDFYDELIGSKEGGDTTFIYSSSLHEAKLKMMESKKFGHPFFWSPFILVGN